MGITGLLPFLEKATRPCHVSEFRNGTVAVDSYCFLHKGANACAEQLARGEDNQMYVYYCMKYVKMLLSYNIHPIMVFDGRNLPAKAETEAKRRESRKKAKQRAAELLRLGKTEEARTYLKQCIDITPKMAHNLIEECQKMNVDCIVSPYESDAQMAYFNLKGVAECVITEDSDLVLFGCKKVLYKLDLQGAGRLVEADKICMAMRMRPDQFTFDKFRFMCILSGCDYVSSLSGIGLKKAEKFLKLTAETNPEIFLDRIPRYLNMKHLIVTDEYKRNVLIANATFLHQIVFDPYKKKLVNLRDPEVIGTNPEYLVNSGEKFNDEKAYQVALGNLNPYNFEVLGDWKPSNLSPYSIWSGVCRKRVSRKLQNETQRSSLKKYMTENVTTTTCNDETVVLEEEDQINNDLAIYTRKSDVDEETKKGLPVVPEESPNDIKAESKTSPIISKNPFLRRKRISKFPKTYTCGNTIVKSRFFCSPSNTNEDSEEIQLSPNENILDSVKPDILEDKKEPIELVNSSVDKEKPDSGEILKSHENNSEHASSKRPFNELIAEEVPEKKSDVKEISVKHEKTEQQINTLDREATEPQGDIKRRKLGPCRTIGLKKKNPGQQTLHNFFNKLGK